ncbi:LysR family transcriptional regulator [Rhodobacteraceae bacterium N5(2021)]|uniref:LysR family transcriptional regulator n=1 Tax=Gymnodinialimonas phycosphaerae TaxID=2841589 RepID=A0A975TSV6_9RHOB|nr:LysR family transcriptional regulator [Gymnodinialimonas phycosphaerae]MBY4893945.1 LysR family transcriptional regulator [Gymnodinialimonas phycosphaerae]
MMHLNYHHLRHFREVAHEGNLTRAAEKLNVAQSALSVQIRALEDRLGHPLFERIGRRLELTEVGRIALDHADRIFETGQELLTTLSGAGSVVPPFRVGAASTLSRNFQLQFLRPALQAAAPIVLSSGPDAVLLDSLKAMSLDVVLSTEPPRQAVGADLIAHRLDAQAVGLHGTPERLTHATLQQLLAAEPFIIPTDPTIRAGFTALSAQYGVMPTIIADVDDMAMVRLLAREGVGVAVAPAVVLRDELSSGLLATAPFTLDIQESFFAITLRRSFPHPLLAGLLSA